MVDRKGAVPLIARGQHRTEEHDEERIEGGFLRERAAVTDPDEGKTDDENEKTADRNLEQSQLSRLAVRAEERSEEVLKRVHANVSRGRAWGARMDLIAGCRKSDSRFRSVI